MKSGAARRKKVLVILNDAGAGEIVGAYLKAGRVAFKAYVVGPSVRIFHRLGLPYSLASKDLRSIANIIKRNSDATFLLTGTGWMTKTEQYGLSEAKRAGLKTCVYLESWNDYRERFDYPKAGWQKNLPDEIWVGDKYAKAIAKREFPIRQKIRFVENEYFSSIVSRYRALSRTRSKPDTILFMSDATPGSEKRLKEILKYLEGRQEHRRIVIRLHPADKLTRYDKLIRRYSDMRIQKSRDEDIVKDLVRAEVVIGAETVAMAAAVLTGKKTISLTHPSRKPFLPFTEIVRVEHAYDAANLL